MKLAILITCHNRKDKTLRCIDCVYKQVNLKNKQIQIVLVDDGGTDGTSDVIKSLFPEIVILQGDGSLYWSGGMRLAMDYVFTKNSYKHIIWLNDDTYLLPNALSRLLDAYESSPIEKKIIVGSTCDQNSRQRTYGGSKSISKWLPLRFEAVHPGGDMVECDTFNGNLILLPYSVAKEVGNIHPEMRHGIGDYEYGLRAKKSGVRLWVAPGYYGYCSHNSTKLTWLDESLPLKLRYKKLLGVKGLPLKSRFAYYKEHGGVFWFLICFLVYIRPLACLFKIKV